MKCHVCSKNVYEIEKVLAINKTYHKNCFKCGINNDDGCGRIVPPHNYLDHAGTPYCVPCYTKLFSSTDQKVSSSSTVPTTSKVIDAPPPSKSSVVVVSVKEAPKCCVCDQIVYKFDEHKFLNKTYHKKCFRCGGIGSQTTCRQLLSLTKFHIHDDDQEPYCTQCMKNLFGTDISTCMHDGLREPVVLQDDWEVKELDPWSGEPVEFTEDESFWVDKTNKLEKKQRTEPTPPIQVEGGSIHDRAKALYKDKNVVKVDRKL